MKPQERLNLMHERFAALEPLNVHLIDESHLHAGHAGAQGGAGHYRLEIISAQFQGLSRIARHRLVYHQVADLMPHEIHALNIVAQTPQEAGFVL